MTLLVSFAGGPAGRWRVLRNEAVTGAGLEPVERLAMVEGKEPVSTDAAWVLRGVVGPPVLTTDEDRAALEAVQEGLGRPLATRAALIPVRKSDAWWNLRLAERRRIFKESAHVSIGLDYLPAVARRLHHGRGLGEPFDFLTWFEYAPEHADAFEGLVRRLRDTEEWTYVEREVDLRLTLD